MRIFKYILFCSVLSSVFFIIFKQVRNEKGFKRWLISFKIAVIFAASVSGLISIDLDNTEFSIDNNTIYQEKVLVTKEYNALVDKSKRIILVKRADASTGIGKTQLGLFNLPPNQCKAPKRSTAVTPYGRTSSYKPTPKLVNQGLNAKPRKNGSGNGSGSAPGGGSNKKSTTAKKGIRRRKSHVNNFHEEVSNYKKKKKRAQCQLEDNPANDNQINNKIILKSRINEDPGLKAAAEKACKNREVQNDVNHLRDELLKGNMNPGIGSKPIVKGIIELRAQNGGRLYIRKKDGVIEILAKSGKKQSNQRFVIDRLRKLYG